SAMVASYVDQGSVQWDQPVVDAWSGFRAPTDALTRTLRVRDLLGMASGIRDPYTTNLHQMTADQLVESLVTMPVIGAVGSTFFYSNTVFAIGGYVPLLATGVAPRDLEAAYAEAMRTRIFAPAGMPGTVLVSDPLGVVDDYATGYIVDTRGRVVALPYGPMGSGAPAGGAQASVTDMAAWVRLQLRQGRSVSGRPVVSATNLAECWRPHVDVPTEAGSNVRRTRYAMGWNVSDYQDGTQVTLHTGSWDGFSTFMAFLPQHDLGLVVLTNMEPEPTGRFWMEVVLDSLLSRRLGLNVGGGQAAIDGGARAVAEMVDVGRQAVRIDPKKVQPHLGYYEGNWSLVMVGSSLQLRIGPRVGTLLLLPDGTYFVSASTLQGLRVELGRDADGTPHLAFGGYETVRRMSGLG
ncbi:MAG TPA: serine hydrolase domain-containing protein, partial [Lapillicoccus sp.]|nr:serine hydrolase domain-containing protein [Lapillicoccus sp.]